MKELYRAVVQRRPILAILEPDASQDGGLNQAEIEALITEELLSPARPGGQVGRVDGGQRVGIGESTSASRVRVRCERRSSAYRLLSGTGCHNCKM